MNKIGEFYWGDSERNRRAEEMRKKNEKHTLGLISVQH